MLSDVHSMNNVMKVFVHAHTNNNIQENRGNCCLAVMELYDYLKEQKLKAKQIDLLTELGESLPVCVQGKCNFIREFVEIKQGD